MIPFFVCLCMYRYRYALHSIILYRLLLYLERTCTTTSAGTSTNAPLSIRLRAERDKGEFRQMRSHSLATEQRAKHAVTGASPHSSHRCITGAITGASPHSFHRCITALQQQQQQASDGIASAHFAVRRSHLALQHRLPEEVDSADAAIRID